MPPEKFSPMPLLKMLQLEQTVSDEPVPAIMPEPLLTEVQLSRFSFVVPVACSETKPPPAFPAATELLTVTLVFPSAT